MPFTIDVVNHADRSMSVPVDITIGPDLGADLSSAAASAPVTFYSTQIFVGAGGEATEDVVVTPAQWYGTSGRFTLTASVDGEAAGEPLLVDVGEADVVVPRFEEVAADVGIVTSVPAAGCGQFSNGAAWADIDGDDDLDLLVTRLGDPMALFVNDGTGHFTDEATERGLGFGDANNVALRRLRQRRRRRCARGARRQRPLARQRRQRPLRRRVGRRRHRRRRSAGHGRVVGRLRR